MTAIEWLVETITSKHDKSFIEFYKAEIEKTKEMEKKQIIDAITQYEIKHRKIFSEQGIINVVNKAEQYYNETYKNEAETND